MLAGCHSADDADADATPAAPARPLVGGVERLDPALDALVAADARVEVLAQGYKWSEGPVWTGGALLFSDVPNNVDLALAGPRRRPRVPAAERLHGQRPARRRTGIERAGRRRRRAPAHVPARRSAHRAPGRGRQDVRDGRRSLRRQALQQPERSGGARRTATSTSPIRSTASRVTRRIRSARSRGAASTARAPAAASTCSTRR